ncbi:hypothetical protein [Microbulbifer sp. HZ11]|uniref:hypothetical protein n=1 Tax=unclassified Microbulbifer TaxID=2619833 RepID=UPI00068BB364|nr:hypothetical protein [Microbulbifer sp. HZ11]
MRQPWIHMLCMALMTVVMAGCDASHNKSDGSADTSPAEEVKEMPADKPDSPSGSAQGGSADAVSPDSATGDSNLWVMQPRGNRQCEGGGRTLEASAAQLVQNGIKVQESRCATRTDRMYPSVCGGATGDLLVHRIPASFLDAALELGFDPVKPGAYQFGDCPKEASGGGSSVY